MKNPCEKQRERGGGRGRPLILSKFGVTDGRRKEGGRDRSCSVVMPSPPPPPVPPLNWVQNVTSNFDTAVDAAVGEQRSNQGGRLIEKRQ